MSIFSYVWRFLVRLGCRHDLKKQTFEEDADGHVIEMTEVCENCGNRTNFVGL